MSVHFPGYQDSCNKNISKYAFAFYWFKLVSMVWLSLCIPVSNIGVIFPSRKKKTYSESLGRGWVSLLQMLYLALWWQVTKPLCSLNPGVFFSRLHSPQQRRSDPASPSPPTPAWGPGLALASKELPQHLRGWSLQVRLCRDQVTCEKQQEIWNLDGRNPNFHWKDRNNWRRVTKLWKNILLVFKQENWHVLLHPNKVW